MEKKRGLTLIGAIVVLGISLIIAATMISNAIIETGHQVSNSMSYSDSNFSEYELEFSEGFMYLHDKTTGQIWRKPELSGEPWVEVPHFASEVQYD